MATTGPTVHRTMTAGEWGLLVLLSLLWGGAYVFTTIIVRELTPLTTITLRLGLAALLLLAVARLSGRGMPRDWRIWRAFGVMGLLSNVVPFYLFAWSQQYINGGLASIFTATTPLFGIFVAHLATTDERLTVTSLAGTVLGFLGVLVMIGADLLSAASASILAQLACLGGALCFALAGLYARRFRTLAVTPMQTAAGQVTASSLILLPVALVVDQPWRDQLPSLPVIGSVLALALLATAFAYLIYFRVLQTAGVTNLLLVNLMVPVSALAVGAIALDEAISAQHVAGLLLIGLGLVIVDGRLGRLLLARRRALPSAAD